MLRVLLYTLGGPLSFIPQPVLEKGISLIPVPSPLLLIQTAQWGVQRASLVLQLPALRGLRRVLISLTDSPLVAAAPAPSHLDHEQQARLLAPLRLSATVVEDYEPLEPFMRMPTTRPPPPTVAEAEAETEAEVKAVNVDSGVPLVLELSAAEMRMVEEGFEGEQLTMSTAEFRDFLARHQVEGSVRLAAVVEAPLDASWQPAELCLSTRIDHDRRQLRAELLSATESPRHDEEVQEKDQDDGEEEDKEWEEEWLPLEAVVPQ